MTLIINGDDANVISSLTLSKRKGSLSYRAAKVSIYVKVGKNSYTAIKFRQLHNINASLWQFFEDEVVLCSTKCTLPLSSQVESCVI